ncbi:MAG TPA: SPOR domain-containing protein [Chitinophagaceae bacterium]|jgi:hypothetical protein|nr:SPOR domain-containing protein [Chitinophagaceae bacterium]
MMKFLFLILFLFASFISFSQTDPNMTVVVHKDPRVDLLVKKQASINTTTKKAYARNIRGYRLMVMNTNKREDAIAAKTKVYTYFPELKAYLLYQAPFFRLKAGNFKSRDEADRYRKQMAPLFPKGVFIVNDLIEVKGEKVEDETDEID